MIPGAANPLLLGGGGYQIQRSLRFRASATASLSRTPAAATSGAVFTFSFWMKRGALGGSQYIFNAGTGGSITGIVVGSDSIQTLWAFGSNCGSITAPLLRDPAAWYHVLWVVDTNLATATDREKFYVNGVRASLTGSQAGGYVPQTYGGYIGTTNIHRIGQYFSGGSNFDGYLAEVNFIDGQALTPSSFGQTDPDTGQWTAAKYGGAYGTNGFYLPFADNSALTTSSNVGLGEDFSGNGNYWTTNNISITAGTTYDSMTDVPLAYGTVDRGNHATVNPLDNSGTIAEGALKFSQAAAAYVTARGTMGMSSGKWVWEATIVAGGAIVCLGIANDAARPAGAAAVNAWMYDYDGVKYTNGAGPTAYGATFTTNDVLRFEFDADTRTLECFKNNATQGILVSGLPAGTYFPWVALYNTVSVVFNFGQRPFANTPTSGFKALHTGNLPAATIQKPNRHFDIALWAGNATNRSITGVAFQPDFAWIKNRSNANSHILTDSVRGVTSQLFSDLTAAQEARTDRVTAFNTDGISLGTYTDVNAAATNLVGWLWKAGGAAVTNNAGSISAQVSANAAAGFSIVTYTGTGANATVGHGLGVAPKMLIVKARTVGNSWMVFHSAQNATPASGYLSLNQTLAFSTDATIWNSTVPSATVFSLGSNSSSNNAAAMVAYCFAEIPGFSKFGSYTGNGSTDGAFVYCGFRPRYLMVKRVDTTGDWIVKDTARDITNVASVGIYPNLSVAENSGTTDVDLTSNGFKLRNSGGGFNASGGTYIFAAFAETPFNSALAR